MYIPHQWEIEQIIRRANLGAGQPYKVRRLHCQICGTRTEVPAETFAWRDAPANQPCFTIHQESKRKPPRDEYNHALCGYAYTWRTPDAGPKGIIRDPNLKQALQAKQFYRINCPDCLIRTRLGPGQPTVVATNKGAINPP